MVTNWSKTLYWIFLLVRKELLLAREIWKKIHERRIKGSPKKGGKEITYY